MNIVGTLKEKLNMVLLSFKDFDYELDEAIKPSYDPQAEAQKSVQQSLICRIKSREYRYKRKVEAALKRIEKGEYGICEECGEAISDHRLMARPVATLCIYCQEASERSA